MLLCSWLWFINSGRIHSKISKWKIAWAKVWRKPEQGFQESSAKDMLNSCSIKVWKTGWSVVYQESALETQCPMLLLGAGSCRHPFLFSICPNFTLAERKEFSINFLACIDSWGTVGHTTSSENGGLPTVCVPSTPKGLLANRPLLAVVVSGLLFTLFCTCVFKRCSITKSGCLHY